MPVYCVSEFEINRPNLLSLWILKMKYINKKWNLKYYLELVSIFLQQMTLPLMIAMFSLSWIRLHIVQ